MPNSDQAIHEALRKFADTVRKKFKALASGAPEDQLRSPLENFLAEVGKALGHKIVAKGESQLSGRLGRPDYAVVANKLLAGYVELKEPGKGANPNNYKGHDKKQWERFKSLPNVLYIDGNEWSLYRDGKRIGHMVRLHGDITKSGKSAVKPENSDALNSVLTDFLSWDPIVPKDAKALAELLAPLCKMLRQEVKDALKAGNAPIVHLADAWRKLIISGADDDRIADAYAQTVTFALLLARSEGAKNVGDDLHSSIKTLAVDHALLSRALDVLTDQQVRDEIQSSLRLLQRVIDRVPTQAMKGSGGTDPWLYFYEDFLAAYDPKLRKDAGAYYTPVEVVHAQVRLIDHLLVNKLKRPMGFADSDVITLDPAVGTGTYLLGVIDHAMQRIAHDQGAGAVPAIASQLGRNIYGFEIMVGPYAVSELRISRDLLDRGASLPKSGLGVYLTDTLESPHTETPQVVLGFAEQELAEQHKRALKVKDNTPVLVCLGNPPYDRHDAVDATDPGNIARTGGWVRFGDPLAVGTAKTPKPIKHARKSRKKEPDQKRVLEEILTRRQEKSIFRDFVQVAKDAGHGGDVKNLYNLYLYFWRWALWKVFEHKSATGPGIVSYISASSYLDGDAFVGVREHMRRICDEIWIIDLGGEGRGTRKTENVFAIQTPVAIAVAVCYKKADREKPAQVHYTRIEGTRDEKLAKLDSINSFSNLKWQTCPVDWNEPFLPAGKGTYFDSPLLIDLMPWQHSDVKVGRVWPIAPHEQTLNKRWDKLCSAGIDERVKLFINRSTGKKITDAARTLPPKKGKLKPIRDVPQNASFPGAMRYPYRSFDRQFIIYDGRLIDRPGPPLWSAHSEQQVYVTTLLNHPLGTGPAATACAHIPDLHHFRGSFGAREAIPLFRDAAAKHPNIMPGLLDTLKVQYKRDISPQDFLAYLYGILAQPAFTERFHKELESREVRVPLTKDGALFERVAEIGRKLLWLHTYGERFTGKSRPKGKVPKGSAKCTKSVPQDSDNYPDTFNYDPATKKLHIGTGVFEPVAPEILEFEVSGLKVVKSWLGYRMKAGKGKKSSPLDDIRPDKWTAQFTTELLELLWVLEHTIALYPTAAELLEEVLAGEKLAKANTETAEKDKEV